MSADLLLAFALVAGAVALLVAEFFIVSFGVLATAALACAAGGIYVAFGVNAPTGWAFAVGAPTVLGVITRLGVRRIRASRLVPRAEVTADAGYHHAAEARGAAVGSRGVMVTPARPTGRARFSAGECDVQCRGGTLEAGAPVEVVEIDGPMILVVPATEQASMDEPRGKRQEISQ